MGEKVLALLHPSVLRRHRVRADPGRKPGKCRVKKELITAMGGLKRRCKPTLPVDKAQDFPGRSATATSTGVLSGGFPLAQGGRVQGDDEVWPGDCGKPAQLALIVTKMGFGQPRQILMPVWQLALMDAVSAPHRGTDL